MLSAAGSSACRRCQRLPFAARTLALARRFSDQGTRSSVVRLGDRDVYDDTPVALRDELRERGLDKLTLSMAERREGTEGVMGRLSERDELLLKKLTENLPPQFQKLKGTVPEPATVSTKGVLALRGRERELYDLHLEDPARWNPKTLGIKYGISRVRAQAVIMLERIHDERLARGDLDEDPLEALDLSTVLVDMSAYDVDVTTLGVTGEGEEEEAAAADAVAAAEEAKAASGATEGGDVAGTEEDEEGEAAPPSARALFLAEKRAHALKAVEEDDLDLDAGAFAFFDEHGYFPTEARDLPRRRLDEGRKGRLPANYILRDDETVADVVQLVESRAAVEHAPKPPKPFVAPAHEVLRTVNLDKSARFKRKTVIEDISVGKQKKDVRILDHDGTLRSADPAELLHRHQLHNGRRRKK